MACAKVWRLGTACGRSQCGWSMCRDGGRAREDRPHVGGAGRAQGLRPTRGGGLPLAVGVPPSRRKSEPPARASLCDLEQVTHPL